MKKIFTLLALFAVAFAVVSCEEATDTFDDNNGNGNGTTTTQPEVIPSINYTDASGDQLTLAAYTNYWGVVTEDVYVAEGDAITQIAFYDNNEAGYTCSYDATQSSWNGFAVSTHATTDVTVESTEGGVNYEYEFSVYAPSDADADGAFVVGYYAAYWSETYPGFTPTIKFDEPKNLSTVAVAPAAVVASFCKLSSILDPTFRVTIVGYNAANEVVASTYITLADSDFNITPEWRTVYLSQFENVSSLEFEVSCNDYYAPTYFCVDALKFE